METEAPLRRTTWRSGSVPASAARHVAQAPQPPSGTATRPRSRAPPRGRRCRPARGRGRRAPGWRAAARSASTASSWPTTPAKSAGTGRVVGHPPGTGTSSKLARARRPRYGPSGPGSSPRRRRPASGRARRPPGPGTPRAPVPRKPDRVAPSGPAARRRPVRRRGAPPPPRPGRRPGSRGRPPSRRWSRRPAHAGPSGRGHAHNPGRRSSSPHSGRSRPIRRWSAPAPTPVPHARPGPPLARVPRPAVMWPGHRAPAATARSARRACVAPGSRVSRAPRAAASARAWVDFPHPSMPSSTSRRPRARAGMSEGVGRRCLHRRICGTVGLCAAYSLLRPRCLLRGLLAAAFFVDFLALPSSPAPSSWPPSSCASTARRRGALPAFRRPGPCRSPRRSHPYAGWRSSCRRSRRGRNDRPSRPRAGSSRGPCRARAGAPPTHVPGAVWAARTGLAPRRA